MTKTNPLNIFAVALLLTGCASTYDLSQGGTGALGGGYLEEEIIDGVYRLEVRLNISLFSTQAYANEEWHRRARKRRSEARILLRLYRSQDTLSRHHAMLNALAPWRPPACPNRALQKPDLDARRCKNCGAALVQGPTVSMRATGKGGASGGG